MERIYIVEDEASIREELCVLLENAGYSPLCAGNFSAAAAEVKQLAPQLILLDINLPGADGFALCTAIRAFCKTPIIFITGRDTSLDELRAFSLGGDDYITKPYNAPVLLARVASVLKRSRAAQTGQACLCHHGVTLDLAACRVCCGAKSAELSKKELQLLHCLLLHKGTYVSRVAVIEYLWDYSIYTDDNALSVNITRLREKLNEIGAPDYITTKRGMGYKV